MEHARTMSPSVMSAADYTLARNLMVDGQLRPNRVVDRRILDAMRSLPREMFVPEAQSPLAYIDQDIPLGGGRVLLKPLVIARLLQLARPRAGETALVVGAGAGYGAAILAACGAHVVALEDDEALCASARQRLKDNPGVTIVHGKLAEGYPASAPYDLVVIEGAVPAIPDAIGAQVAAGGRLAAIILAPGAAGKAVLAEPSTNGRLSAQPAFDANAPYLPGLAPVPSFTF
jgi:protein-L-isoaspartate(D-aspartate) O-methyltransferase